MRCRMDADDCHSEQILPPVSEMRMLGLKGCSGYSGSPTNQRSYDSQSSLAVRRMHKAFAHE